jgi:hypothetical protein
MIPRMAACAVWAVALIAAMGCGKASPSRDGGVDSASDVPRDGGAVGRSPDAATEGVAFVDAPTGSTDALAVADTRVDALTADAPGDSPRVDTADASDGIDADDPRCGLPGSGACVCDGFVMPNPAGANLPNQARYELVGTDQVVDDVSGLVWERSPSVDHLTQPAAVTHCLAAITGGQGGLATADHG